LREKCRGKVARQREEKGKGERTPKKGNFKNTRRARFHLTEKKGDYSSRGGLIVLSRSARNESEGKKKLNSLHEKKKGNSTKFCSQRKDAQKKNEETPRIQILKLPFG